jgi:hypothetical protein
MHEACCIKQDACGHLMSQLRMCNPGHVYDFGLEILYVCYRKIVYYTVQSYTSLSVNTFFRTIVHIAWD